MLGLSLSDFSVLLSSSQPRVDGYAIRLKQSFHWSPSALLRPLKLFLGQSRGPNEIGAQDAVSSGSHCQYLP